MTNLVARIPWHELIKREPPVVDGVVMFPVADVTINGGGGQIDPVTLADRWFRAARRFDAVFRTRQIGPSATQLDILNLLAEKGTVSLMEAAEGVGISGATAARAVNAAAGRGWLLKDRDPQDRRVVWLRTTEEGSRIRAEMRTLAAEHLAQLLSGAVPEDVQVLDRLLLYMGSSASDAETSSRTPL